MIVIRYAFLDFILGLSDISTVLPRIDSYIITKLHYLVKILFISKSFKNILQIFL